MPLRPDARLLVVREVGAAEAEGHVGDQTLENKGNINIRYTFLDLLNGSSLIDFIKQLIIRVSRGVAYYWGWRMRMLSHPRDIMTCDVTPRECYLPPD